VGNRCEGEPLAGGNSAGIIITLWYLLHKWIFSFHQYLHLRDPE